MIIRTIKGFFRAVYWTIRFALGYFFWVLGAPFMFIGGPLWATARFFFGVKKPR